MFASALMSSRLRKTTTAEGPLCRGKSRSAPVMADVKLTVSVSENALENVVETILTPITFLTKKQRKCITVTWLAVKDRTQFGARVYAEVFRRQPQLQDYFPCLRGQPAVQDEVDLQTRSAFRCQAAAFADFLDYIVSFVHLDSANFISDSSVQIGRRHAERLKSIDTMPLIWWRTFTESIICCLGPHFPIGDTAGGRLPIWRHVIHRTYRRAWEALLKVVVENMQRGFGDYKKEEVQFLQGNRASGQLPPAVSPYQSHLKKLAALAAAVQANKENKKKAKFYQAAESGAGSDEDDLCGSDDTSSNSGSD